MTRRRAILLLLVVGFLFYLGSYLAFPTQHAERWEKDQLVYVIFPPDNKALYYIYRPLVLVDGPVTGMRFHIGPHR